MSLFPQSALPDEVVYVREAACVDAAEAIAAALTKSGKSRADLARLLNVSAGEVTVRLRGGRNLTVATLAETLHVLGADLEIRAVPRDPGRENTGLPHREVSDRVMAWSPRVWESSSPSANRKHLPERKIEAWH